MTHLLSHWAYYGTANHYCINHLPDSSIEPAYFTTALILNWKLLYYLVSHKLSTEIETLQ